ncbi:MAG: alpha/beta hydrolase [Bacteroidetes bacterium]|nr:alpha/beta hydrolase [Bacteroidota bacterium]
MKVYFIPGLGADKRVFKNIRLSAPNEMICLEWIDPLPGENLTAYALRLAEKIDTAAPWSLVGLSFGGMLAAEISARLQPAKTILISSIASPQQLPPYFKAVAPLGLQKILPVALFKQASIAKRVFSTETAEDKALLRQIIDDSDPAFIKWALGAILRWKTTQPAPPMIHIHGDSDFLLPVRYVQPTFRIKKAGHLLVMNHAEEVNKILREVFAA